MPDTVTSAKQHDPDTKRPYGITWSGLNVTETIATSTWTLAVGTATLGNSVGDTPGTTKAGTISGAQTSVWVLSATVGTVQLKNRIVTSEGRQFDRTVTLSVAEQ